MSTPLQRLLKTLRTAQPRENTTVPRPRQRQKRLTDDEAAEAISGYLGGETVVELALRLGCHRVTIAKQLRAAGVQLRLDPLTSSEIDEAVRLYESGLSLAKVGERVGATARTVQLKLRERGVQMRDTHGRIRA